MTSTKHPSYKAEIVMVRDGSGREDYALCSKRIRRSEPEIENIRISKRPN